MEMICRKKLESWGFYQATWNWGVPKYGVNDDEKLHVCCILDGNFSASFWLIQEALRTGHNQAWYPRSIVI